MNIVKKLLRRVYNVTDVDYSHEDHPDNPFSVVFNVDNLDVYPLNKKCYNIATQTLKELAKIADLWSKGTLDNASDKILSKAMSYFLDYNPDYRDEKGELMCTEEERSEHFRKAKDRFELMVIEAQEHFDLRLCATEANKVAISIGRSGVRITFQDLSRDEAYHSLTDGKDIHNAISYFYKNYM